jgi:hypothetical protein
MRRNLKPYIIKEFYPLLFWQKCDLCNEEFKKENAWKIYFRMLSKVICGKCAPTFKDADELALTWGDNGDCKPRLRLPRHTVAPPPSPPTKLQRFS